MTPYRSITVNFLDGSSMLRSGTDACPVTIAQHADGYTVKGPEDIVHVPVGVVKYIEARPVMGHEEIAALMRKERA